ncbi:MAG: SDR family oxidoreductase [Austwickia sp.]|nr:MAG: SDR family oxidoreductase [Austwickia sp.]
MSLPAVSRTALITGATGGLGRAVAIALAEAGLAVALHHRRSAQAAEELRDDLAKRGARATVVIADLSAADVDAVCARLLDDVAAALAVPDVVVLAAGAQEVTPWDGLDAAAWDAMYAGTLRHTAVLLHQAAARMRPERQPAIVVVGSVEGLRAARGHAPYAVAKAALHHLVGAAAEELGPRGIRVVGVAPGLIDRPGLAEEWPHGHRRWSRAAALGRPVAAAEVAAAIAFLASPGASGITGVVLPVDAGWSCAPGW